VLRKRCAVGIIVNLDESRFEIIPPEQQPFVVMHKRHATGIIVIVEES